MKYLFIDINNTGFYHYDSIDDISSSNYDTDDDYSIYDIEEMPRLNVLNWILCDSEQIIISEGEHIFNTSHDDIETYNYLKDVFLSVLNEADMVIGRYDVKSDLKVIGTEFMRLGFHDIVSSKAICSYATSKDVIRWYSKSALRKQRHDFSVFQAPSDRQLYLELFGEDIENDASVREILHLEIRIFFELRKKSILHCCYPAGNIAVIDFSQVDYFTQPQIHTANNVSEKMSCSIINFNPYKYSRVIVNPILKSVFSPEQEVYVIYNKNKEEQATFVFHKSYDKNKIYIISKHDTKEGEWKWNGMTGILSLEIEGITIILNLIEYSSYYGIVIFNIEGIGYVLLMDKKHTGNNGISLNSILQHYETLLAADVLKQKEKIEKRNRERKKYSLELSKWEEKRKKEDKANKQKKELEEKRQSLRQRKIQRLVWSIFLCVMMIIAAFKDRSMICQIAINDNIDEWGNYFNLTALLLSPLSFILCFYLSYHIDRGSKSWFLITTASLFIYFTSFNCYNAFVADRDIRLYINGKSEQPAYSKIVRDLEYLDRTSTGLFSKIAKDEFYRNIDSINVSDLQELESCKDNLKGNYLIKYLDIRINQLSDSIYTETLKSNKLYKWIWYVNNMPKNQLRDSKYRLKELEKSMWHSDSLAYNEIKDLDNTDTKKTYCKEFLKIFPTSQYKEQIKEILDDVNYRIQLTIHLFGN